MDGSRDLVWHVIVPVVQWGAAVLVAVGLAYWLAGVLRRMDEVETPGHRPCPRCGYDVRATPQRCPECGYELPAEPAVAGGDFKEQTMPVYTIPPNATAFEVVQGPDGGFAVAERRAVGADAATAANLGFVFIPCRDESQAREVAQKLNRREHDGTIRVDLLEARTSNESA